MINVLIVDDHELVRLGIRRLLEDVDGIKVVAEAESGEQALEVARKELIDVVLMDVKMEGIGGLEATRRLLRFNPDVKVIALTACIEDPFPSRLLQAGAFGFLSKQCDLAEMVLAIKKVHAGQRYIIPEVAQQLAIRSVSPGEKDGSPFELLSERELQVMYKIVRGVKVQDISTELCLSTKTVNSYRYRIFEKLNVSNDVALTLLAIRHDLLDKESLAE